MTIDDIDQLEAELSAHGELMVVLESDREYALHPHDTVFRQPENVVETEGIEEDGNEYIKAVFSPEKIEHYYVHREI